jgi:hypothetical protein
MSSSVPPAAGGPYFTLAILESAIRASWSIETCDPVDVPNWTPANPARGQCGVTSLLVHDLVGGQLLGAEVSFPDGTRQGFHYWNRLHDLDVDLTREQFTDGEVVLEPRVIDRPPGLPTRGAEQYLLFRERVLALLQSEASPTSHG